ncbi:MAG: Cof-type HAD-IIB family hydrolase [Streptococcaceae bacterium]|nr:Cof-type HAD-IIB family hydrolase [Streptococcaceae bacterium]
MNPKLIALDLDGTTLNQAGELSEYTKKVIKQIVNDGHFVVIATGRPYRMAISYYQELLLQTPMVNFNGALTHHPQDKSFKEASFEINRDDVRALIINKPQFQFDFVAAEYRKKVFIDRLENAEAEIFGQETLDEKFQFVLDKMTKNPQAVLIQSTSENKEQFSRDLNFYFEDRLSIKPWGGPNRILEIIPKNVNKTTGLKLIAERLGVKSKDVIAFGDEMNDFEMIEYAGVGIALKNATPKLKEIANFETLWDNDHDGVAKTLQQLLL